MTWTSSSLTWSASTRRRATAWWPSPRGIHYADGSFVSEAKTSATDGFGHAQLGGLASLLANVVKEKTGAKVRGIELSLLQRCGAHLASETDIEEAVMSGKAAVENAVGRHHRQDGGLRAHL